MTNNINIIYDVKKYLKSMKSLVKENTHMNSLIMKREIILKKINMINSYLFELEIVLTKLLIKHRKVIQIYWEADSEIEKSVMIEKLDISKSTYNRLLKSACLELSQFIDYKSIITMESINKQL